MAALDFGFCLSCLAQRGIGGYGDKSVQNRIQLFNFGQAIASQFDGREFAATELMAKFQNRYLHRLPGSKSFIHDASLQSYLQRGSCRDKTRVASQDCIGFQ